MDDEIVLCYFRRHWIQVLPSIATLPISFAIFLGAFIFRVPLTTQTLLGATLLSLGLLLLTVIAHYQFLSIFRYYLSTVILTNMRVVILDKSVFFRDTNTTIDLSKIQDIQKKQVGVFQHVFRFGTIRVSLSGGDPIEIYLVPTPDFYFKKMNEVKQDMSEEPGPNPGNPVPTTVDPQEQGPSITVPFLETTSVK